MLTVLCTETRGPVMQPTSLTIRESRGLPVKTPGCQPQQIGDESLARAGCKYYDSEQGEVACSRS